MASQSEQHNNHNDNLVLGDRRLGEGDSSDMKTITWLSTAAEPSRVCSREQGDDATVFETVTVSSGPSPREGHCSCTIADSFYVFGGVSINRDGGIEENADLWRFNSVANEWVEIQCSGERPLSRSAAVMVAVGRKIYLFGGLSQAAGWLDDFFIFDTETNTWFEEDNSTGHPPSARDKTCGAVVDSRIYLFGGFGPQSVRPFDAENEDDDDSELSDLEAQQEAAQFGWFDDLYVYDTLSKTWSQPMQLSLGKPSPRCAASMVAFGSTLVIFGGRDSEGRTNDTHYFNTVTRKWEKVQDVSGTPPSCRSFHAACLVDNKMVVVGGRGLANQHFSGVHTLDLFTHTWKEFNSVNLPERGCHSLVACGDRLFVFGGSSAFNETLQHCDRFHSDLLYCSIDCLLEEMTDTPSPKKIKC